MLLPAQILQPSRATNLKSVSLSLADRPYVKCQPLSLATLGPGLPAFSLSGFPLAPHAHVPTQL